MFPGEGNRITQFPRYAVNCFCGVLGAPQEFERVKILLLAICSNTGADGRTSKWVCQIQRAGRPQHKTA